MNNKTVYCEWELVHHQDASIMELILRSSEGDEKVWMTYEELANLKKFLGGLPSFSSTSK